MITSVERLGAALRGEPSDRIPVFCNLLDQGARELGLPLEEYYSSGANVAEAQLRMQAKYGHDNVWSLFYVGKEAELLGCQKILFAEDGPPNVEDWVIRSHEDIHALEVPADVTDHPAFEQVGECLRVLKREVGGRVPICAYVTASMALPALLMSMEKWMELLLLGPPAVRDELLAKCHQLFVREVAAYRAAGADVLLYSNPFGSLDTVTRGFFLERSLPWIEKDTQAVGTEGLVYYCGLSRMDPVLEDVLARTGLGAYYLGPFDDVARAAEIVAGRALVCGVINDVQLIDWSPEEIRSEVRRIVEAGRACPRFLFGTGLMPYAIPERNIRTMMEAAFELGARGARRSP